jgi:hypothetical protein
MVDETTAREVGAALVRYSARFTAALDVAVSHLPAELPTAEREKIADAGEALEALADEITEALARET